MKKYYKQKNMLYLRPRGVHKKGRIHIFPKWTLIESDQYYYVFQT